MYLTLHGETITECFLPLGQQTRSSGILTLLNLRPDGTRCRPSKSNHTLTSFSNIRKRNARTTTTISTLSLHPSAKRSNTRTRDKSANIVHTDRVLRIKSSGPPIDIELDPNNRLDPLPATLQDKTNNPAQVSSVRYTYSMVPQLRCPFDQRFGG
jgi:hypothetical protein